MTIFRRKPKEYQAVSLRKLAWRRFKKEKLGMAALLFLGFVFLLALLGYTITPDKTPYCNAQHLEIALKKPGIKVDFLQIKKAQPVENVGFFKRLVFGQPTLFSTIPVSCYSNSNNIVTATLYERPETVSYSLSELSEKKPILQKRFWLGTDRYGRDVLSQLLLGARISLAVGFVSLFIALVIGVFIGAIAGFYGGKVDAFLMWFINVIWSIPTLLLVIAVSFALGKGFWQIFIAIGLTMWVDIARVVRGQVLALKEQEFVEAGRALGFTGFHIIWKHILPNILGTLVVLSAANFSSAILMEAGLSFLGMGVQPPIPSWGMMMKENYAYIVLDNAYLAIVPGIAIMLLVLAFMLIGSALRNAMETKQL